MAASDRRRRLLTISALAAVVTVMLVVLFLLPGWVEPPMREKPPADATTTHPTQSDTSETAAASGAAPWSEAQQAEQRRATQDLIAEMLEVVKQLEAQGVALWGGASYQQGEELAAAGDEAYRQRDYHQARSHYRAALDGFTALLQGSGALYTDQLQRGAAALAAEDAITAAAAFSVALAIKPDSEAAQQGSRRAATLDEVLRLTAQGDDHLDRGELDGAQAAYQQALALDSQAQRPAQQLTLVRQALQEQEFNRLMSSGFAHLDREEFQQADSAFQAAVRLRPASREANNALQQARNMKTSDTINTLIRRAQEHETGEAWQQAVAQYDQALALDGTLASLKRQREHARERAQLDERLQQAIAQPQRLSDTAARQQTTRLLQTAEAVSNPGNRLAQQIASLTGLLEQATTPVRVTLQSDNLTRVTLYRVGELGVLQRKELLLLPGSYVAVGSRSGYRDVRVEFSVDAAHPDVIVLIQCDQRLTAE